MHDKRRNSPYAGRTQLAQSAINKWRPRDTPWAGSLISKRMQELHRRLAEATVRLHGEGYEAIAMRLHSRMSSSAGPYGTLPLQPW
jgi:hypothetical protein